MAATVEQLLTVGGVAERLRARQWKIQYILKTRSIEPAARSGNLRLFGPDEIERIREAVAEMGERKGRARQSGPSR